MTATSSPLSSEHFRQRGLIQQHGAFFIRLGLLLDSTMIFFVLYLLTRDFEIAWDQRYSALVLFMILTFQIVAYFRHLYRSWRLVRLRYEILEIAFLLAVSFSVVAVTLLLGTKWSQDTLHRELVVYWYVFSFFGVAASRVALRLILRYYRAFGHDHRNVAFIGATEATKRLAAIFHEHTWMGVDIVGVYDDRTTDRARPLAVPREQIAGTVDDLWDLARAGQVSAIYISLPMAAEKRIKTIIDRFAETTVSIYYCPTLFDFDLLNARWDDVFGNPVVSIVASPFVGSQHLLKRMEDLVLVTLILPLILLPMAIIAISVKLSSPGPVFYRQHRHGLNGRPFTIWKFRTMYHAERDDEFVQAKKDDARITPLGAFLRRASLDELPQFFNVCLGQMSVVGPRPAPLKYNETHRKLIRRYMVRHKIKPGITGLAQVNGSRGETETLAKTEERTEYDLQYVQNWSIGLDLRILFKTVAAIAAEFRDP
jgi:putative colanic acid biosynthesis UDP-glucose lipid carrier transferase